MFEKLFAQGLAAGTQAPDFSLPDASGRLHSLQEYRGRWLLLYFYPRDQTRGCTLEACSFRDSQENFQIRGLSILGISTDSQDSHQRFSNEHGLNFPLLSDADGRVSKDYGVLLPVPLKTANRVTFLIDPSGRIVENFKWIPWKDYAQVILQRIEAKQLMK